jgi:hypothetical protein
LGARVAPAAAAPSAPSRRGAQTEIPRLGVASYSLRKFPREKAIEMTRALRTPFINL